MMIVRYTAALAGAALLAATCPAPPARAAAVCEVRSGTARAAASPCATTIPRASGPVAFTRGQAELHRNLAMPRQWRREGLQALAFVQDDDAHVLQAVDTATCTTPIAHPGRLQ